MPLQTGQILEQRYRIETLLGQGGMGAVYRAIDLKFNTPVAIKENLTITPDAQRQFTREAGLLHQLRHPNLPRVTDHFSIPGQGQYLVMDHIDGDDLKCLLARQGPLPEVQALDWIGQVLDALEYLHSRQVIHRDVKPANVKITLQGQVFLVDFGLAKVYDPGQETTIGARGATPGYAPPEQYGQGRTDARSDVYSAGATLYSLLCGQVPPDALDMVIRRGNLPSLRQLAPRVSPHVESAVVCAMQTVPEDRFQTARDFHRALHEPATRMVQRRDAGSQPPEPVPADVPPPSAPADTNQRIAALLDQARVALDQQDWTAAEGRCQAALALDSQHAATRQLLHKVRMGRQLDSQYARARAAMNAGDWETATQVLEQVTILDAHYRDAQALLKKAKSERERRLRRARTSRPPFGQRVAVALSGLRQRVAAALSGLRQWVAAALSGLRQRLPSPSPRVLLIGIAVVVALLIVVPSVLLLTGDGGRPATTPVVRVPSVEEGGILFTSTRDGKREIYRLSGGQSERLTRTPGRGESWGPVWTETGILFTSNRDGNTEIYRLRDGIEERVTQTPEGGDSWGAVQTDTGILFTSTRDGNAEIYRLSGGQTERVTHTANGDSWGPVQTDTGILFTSTRDGNAEIYRLSGGQTERVTHTANGESWGPVPTDTGILFTSSRDGKVEIYRLSVGQSERVTHTANGESWGPVWTDTGILFTSTRDGKREIYRLSGGQTERVTHTEGRAESWLFDATE
jgi:Tol biopolymer transport system component